MNNYTHAKTMKWLLSYNINVTKSLCFWWR